MTKTADMPTVTLYSWYQNFYETRVLRKVFKEMASVERDFYPWLAEHGPELYGKITEADDEVQSLWKSQADKESFMSACGSWYKLLKEAKEAYVAWKARQREAALNVGKQEAMKM